MRLFGRSLCSFVFLCAAIYSVRAADDVNAQLRKEYGNKIVLLRNFCEGKSLHFNADGSLQGNCHPGSWTTSFLYVKNIWVNAGNVQFDGKRVAQIAKDGVFKPYLTEDDLSVRIDLSGSSADEIHAALDRTFVGPQERVSSLVPTYWKEFLEKYEESGKLPSAPDSRKLKSGCPSDVAVMNPCVVGGDVKPPKPVFTPDPHYEPLAQKNKYQGTSVLWLVVDEIGQLQNIKVVRAQGFGLDEKAVEAVRGWKFQPATHDGKPVPVQINVEVNFRLY